LLALDDDLEVQKALFDLAKLTIFARSVPAPFRPRG
jgi:hypothetical protein